LVEGGTKKSRGGTRGFEKKGGRRKTGKRREKETGQYYQCSRRKRKERTLRIKDWGGNVKKPQPGELIGFRYQIQETGRFKREGTYKPRGEQQAYGKTEGKVGREGLDFHGGTETFVRGGRGGTTNTTNSSGNWKFSISLRQGDPPNSPNQTPKRGGDGRKGPSVQKPGETGNNQKTPLKPRSFGKGGERGKRDM